jgi:hypothetical protein
LSKHWLELSIELFDAFRCRSVAAAGDLLFFVSPKKPKEKKGDPGACFGYWGQNPNSPSLWLALRVRCECTAAKSGSDPNNRPAVLGPAGVELELGYRLRQSLALIRLALRSSAHSQGLWEGVWDRIRNQVLILSRYYFHSCLRRYSLG